LALGTWLFLANEVYSACLYFWLPSSLLGDQRARLWPIVLLVVLTSFHCALVSRGGLWFSLLWILLQSVAHDELSLCDWWRFLCGFYDSICLWTVRAHWEEKCMVSFSHGNRGLVSSSPILCTLFCISLYLNVNDLK
jgi:hypothetical protein